MSRAKKIDHEWVSVDSLVEDLKQRCGHHSVEVQKNEDDPPDFWVEVDGNRFAVEETSIAEQNTVTKKKPYISVKWEGETQRELTELIQNAVSRKRSKLEKKGVPQQCRDSILLLYDAFGHADPEDAKIAVQNVSGYDWFHSVFWAATPFVGSRPNKLRPQEPGRYGLFLYTKEDRWRGQ